MVELWEQNEEIDEEGELVVTDHRDRDEEQVPPEVEQDVETTAESSREALDELGEDAASSPARRGRYAAGESDASSGDVDDTH